MADIPRASVKQLAYKIKGTGKPSPRFAFLLGAGASRQSGIITAGEMIRFFKDQIVTECCPEDRKTDEEKEKWLKEQDWYNKDGSEYSKLFEKYEPKEIGRQRYIESIIEGKTPSFGYVVLANLMASNYVNTIITTNFDDLTYSACTSFTSIRPIVYAYGVLASEMRVTAPRPKILKLHGDYLYSVVKNTDREIATQDPNMARQVSQVLGEYGLVIAGYSGGDGSVMKILSQISEKNDLYWCIHRGTEPNERVKDLLLQKGGFLIEIDGFDEMMNEVRGIVGFDVGVMIGSTQERQDRMIENLRSFSMQYSASILREIVDALKEQLEQQQDQIRKTEALDYFLKAYDAYENGDLGQAEKFYNEAIKQDSNDDKAHNNLGIIYLNQGKNGEAISVFQRAIEIESEDALYHSNLARAYEAEEKYAEAVTEFRRAIELDPQTAWLHSVLGSMYAGLRQFDNAIVALQRAIELDPKNAGFYNTLGWYWIMKGDLSTGEQELQAAIKLDPNYYPAHLNLGLLSARQGKANDARALWTKGLSLCQGNGLREKLRRAFYTWAVGQTDKGLSHMGRILKEDRPPIVDIRDILEDAVFLASTSSPPEGIEKMLSLLRASIQEAKRR